MTMLIAVFVAVFALFTSSNPTHARQAEKVDGVLVLRHGVIIHLRRQVIE